MTSSGVQIRGNLIDNTDSVEYDVYLYEGEAHSFWAQTGAGLALSDPRLTLLDSGGNVLLADDNSGTGSSAVINFTAPADGYYTLRLDSAPGGTGRLYRLAIDDKSYQTDILDHIGPGTPGVDAQLAVNDTLISIVGSVDDFDVVGVNLTAGVTYTIELRGSNSPFTTLQNQYFGLHDGSVAVLDADGTTIQQELLSGVGDTGLISFTPGSSGTYFISVEGDSGGYGLTLSDGSGGVGHPDTVPADVSSRFSVPLGGTGLNLIGMVQGTVNGAADSDWYAVSLVAGSTYQIDLTATSFWSSALGGLTNPFLEIHDATGALVTSDNDAGSGNNAQLVFTPSQGGIYFLAARDAAAGVGGFDLSLKLIGDPPDPLYEIVSLQDAAHPEIIEGSTRGEILVGGDGDDNLDARSGGAVTLIGGAGADQLRGGPGNDLFPDVGAGDQVSGGDGIDEVDASVSYTMPGDVEILVLTGSADIDGTGDYHNNDIYGNTGANSLNGAEGDDWLDGGDGNDTIDGADGEDIASFAGATAVTVSLAVAGPQDTGRGLDTLVNIEDLGGSSGGDSLTGNQLANIILGGDGDDTVNGLGGMDYLDGGAGNDTASYYGLGAGVTATLASATWQNTGTGGVDWLTGFENLTGTDSADRLTGNAGANSIYGAQGNDTLIGGAGKDLITGAGGLDRSIFTSLSDSGRTFATRDALNTFAHGDKIDLSAIDANAALPGNQAFHFQTAFNHTAGQLIAVKVMATSFVVEADVNGDNVYDFSLNVYTSAGFGSFQSWDFIL